MPQPGWDSAYDWTGYIPFEELPVSFNPDEGYIVTANNAIVGAGVPVLPHERLGLRLAGRADHRAHRAQGRERQAHRRRHARHPGRRAVLDGHAARGRLRRSHAPATTMWMPPSTCCGTWDAQSTADSAAAAYANVLWDELVQNLFVRGRETAAPLSGQGRLFLVVDRLLDDPSSPWWNNPGLDVSGQEEMLERTAEGAYERLAKLQGDRPERWNWGQLHALTLTSGTFGSSGIAPDRVALQPRTVPRGRRQLGRQRDGLDARRGVRDRHGALDADDRRPVGPRRIGLEPPHRRERARLPHELRRPDRDLAAACRLTPWAFSPRGGRRGDHRHPHARPGILTLRGAGRAGAQPPAAGGVSRDSASSSTCSECRSIVPLR